jgi:hypothetical protein
MAIAFFILYKAISLIPFICSFLGVLDRASSYADFPYAIYVNDPIEGRKPFVVRSQVSTTLKGEVIKTSYVFKKIIDSSSIYSRFVFQHLLSRKTHMLSIGVRSIA